MNQHGESRCCVAVSAHPLCLPEDYLPCLTVYLQICPQKHCHLCKFKFALSSSISRESQATEITSCNITTIAPAGDVYNEN